MIWSAPSSRPPIRRPALYERCSRRQTESSSSLIDQLDVEAVLAYAEHLLLNTARLWLDANLDQSSGYNV